MYAVSLILPWRDNSGSCFPAGTKICRLEPENAVRIQSFPDIIEFSPGRDLSLTGKPNQIRVNRLLDNVSLVIYRLLKVFRRQFSIRKWTG